MQLGIAGTLCGYSAAGHCRDTLYGRARQGYLAVGHARWASRTSTFEFFLECNNPTARVGKNCNETLRTLKITAGEGFFVAAWDSTGRIPIPYTDAVWVLFIDSEPQGHGGSFPTRERRLHFPSAVDLEDVMFLQYNEEEEEKQADAGVWSLRIGLER